MKKRINTRKTMACFLIIILLVTSIQISVFASTGPTEQWRRVYDKSRDDDAYAVTTDSENNVIVTGFSDISSSVICYTIKYTAEGTKLTDIKTSSSFRYQTCDVACDTQNNIIIATTRSPSSSSNTNYCLSKYAPNGSLIWERVYDESSTDCVQAVSVDHNNNIVCTGTINQNTHTIKYSPDGVELWNHTYDTGSEDNAVDIAVDTANTIIVGVQTKTATNSNWKLLSYHPSGTLNWDSSFPTEKYNSLEGIATDTNNNIILTGTYYDDANANILIKKYTSSGDEIWQKIFHYSTGDYASAVTTNNFNDIFVCGATFVPLHRKNYLFIKYSEEGTHQWTSTTDRAAEDDHATDITTDSINKIILTGWSKNVRLNTDYLTIKYGASPHANFTYSPPDPTDLDTIQFTDTSQDPAGIITSWRWDFGDNTTSTQQHPTHQYNDDGEYNVTLTITDDDGYTDMIQKTISVSNVAPSSDFIWEPIGNPENNTIHFIDQSVDYDGTILSWTWDFGDGTTGTGKETVHSYDHQGSETVTLTTCDNDGDCDTVEKDIFIPDTIAPQLTDHTATVGYTGDPFEFLATVTDNVETDTVTVTYWYENETAQTTPLMQTAPNNWSTEIILEQTKNQLMYTFNATDTSQNFNTTPAKTVQIIDNDPPEILNDDTPSVATACQPLTFSVHIDDNIKVENVSVYHWKANATPEHLSLLYQSEDIWQNSILVDCNTTKLFYNISAQDNAGNTNQSITKEVNVTPNHPPQKPTNNHPTDGQTGLGQDVTLNVSVSDPDDDLLNVLFYNAKDDSLIEQKIGISSGSTVSIVWSGRSKGTTYHWYVRVDDSIYDTTSDTWSFTTQSASQQNNPSSGGGSSGGGGSSAPKNKKPVADITAGFPYTGMIGETVLFNASKSYDPDGYITSYTWTFKENITKTGKTATYVFNTSGLYNVTLSVQDNDGSISSQTFSVEIKKPNNPPIVSSIQGPTTGTRQTTYTFFINASDEDNDPFTLFINWNDTTYSQHDVNTTDALPYSASHNWTEMGIYQIQIFAIDSHNTTSNVATHQISIDMFYIDDRGYLIDSDSDGTYDQFYSNTTNTTTAVQQQDDGYLIDTDGDGTYDTYFNDNNQTAQAYSDSTGNAVLYLLLFLLLILFLFLLILYALRQTKQRKQRRPRPISSTRGTVLDNKARLSQKKSTWTVQPKQSIPSSPPQSIPPETIRKDFDKVNPKIDHLITEPKINTQGIDGMVDHVITNR